MSSVTRPRGPLPPRVYWARRVTVLAVALLLVVGVGKVLGGGGDGRDDEPAAEIVSGEPTTQPPATRKPGKKDAKKPQQAQPRKPKRTPLPQPQGPCAASDVVVTPSVEKAHAGGVVTIALLVTSKVSPACTFEVSRSSVVLKLTSGDDKIWTTQQCPKAMPTATVIARQQVPGRVDVSWHGHRSNEGCTSAAAWALPGYYHAAAAALGSEATDVQFFLGPALAETITPKPRVRKQPRG
ncbi:MAG TPA: hypothetical protein VFK52_06380 [Nocardioidaceae bacterium]|nr:hypothetical protein [Nocardioidaceae bacterium]